MIYREFKGKQLSALGMGCMRLPVVDNDQSKIDIDAVREMVAYAMEKGISEALFKVRILKNLFRKTPVEIYSFFLGAILASEIEAIIAAPARRVVIGGKAQIKHATVVLLRALSDKAVIVVSDAEVDVSSALGAIRIFEFQA
jgi:2-keto-3-deoxy-galactonokinase